MDSPQVPPIEKTNQNPEKGKVVDTPGMAQITSLPSSNTTNIKPSEIEDGDAEMDLDEHDLVGVDLVHLEQAYRHQKIYTIPTD
jgi:hypothetical protein